LIWSTSADPKFLEYLIKKFKYDYKILKKAKIKYDNKYIWEYRVYKLKPSKMASLCRMRNKLTSWWVASWRISKFKNKKIVI